MREQKSIEDRAREIEQAAMSTGYAYQWMVRELARLIIRQEQEAKALRMILRLEKP